MRPWFYFSVVFFQFPCVHYSFPTVSWLYLSSIEITLLNLMLIAFSKYVRGNSPKKRERILVTQVAFILKVSQRKKTLPIDPVFSSWVHVIKKAPIINCSRNSKSLKGIYFSLKFESQVFSRKSVFFF